MSSTAAANSRPLLLADPAMMKFQFMVAPTKAATPTNAPTIKQIPTVNSPMATTFANQVYAPESSMNWMKLRYQSKVMAGLAGAAGTLTILLQKPLSASPVCIQPGSPSLCSEASTHE